MKEKYVCGRVQTSSTISGRLEGPVFFLECYCFYIFIIHYRQSDTIANQIVCSQIEGRELWFSDNQMDEPNVSNRFDLLKCMNQHYLKGRKIIFISDENRNIPLPRPNWNIIVAVSGNSYYSVFNLVSIIWICSCHEQVNNRFRMSINKSTLVLNNSIFSYDRVNGSFRDENDVMFSNKKSKSNKNS